MFYYKFHIGDYSSHTGHLDHIEDIVYRRMLDWCYLHERPLPNDIDQIAKLIRMRSHSDSIATVLQEFFTRTADGEGWWQDRIGDEIASASEKSEKASKSAKARWEKEKSHANALQGQSERNAIQDPRPITQDPLPKTQDPRPKKKAAVSATRPIDVSESVWNDFMAIRERVKKPFTETAMKIIQREAAKAGFTFEQALETCCARGWQGFEAAWVKQEISSLRPSGVKLNKQEALEASNHAVVQRYLAKQGFTNAE